MSRHNRKTPRVRAWSRRVRQQFGKAAGYYSAVSHTGKGTKARRKALRTGGYEQVTTTNR